MRKYYHFLMALVAMLLPLNYAFAQGSIEIPIGGTTEQTMQLTISWSCIQSEDLHEEPFWLAMSPYGDVYTKCSATKPSIYANWNVEYTSEIWDGATAGTNAGTTQQFPMFRLRNAATGLYIKAADKEGVDSNRTWEKVCVSTSDASKALLFALVPKSTFTDHNYPSDYVLMTNTQCHGYATCLGDFWVKGTDVPAISARKFSDQDWAYSSPCVNCTTQDVQVVEDLAAIYNELKKVNLADYPAGNALGQYNAAAVSAFTKALNDEEMIYNISDLEGDRTDATAWNYITALHSAYTNMLNSKNKPNLNGYYRIVNTATDWGVEKALGWQKFADANYVPNLFWETLDMNKISQIWKIEYSSITGKYLMTNLDSYYRIDTGWNYQSDWESMYVSEDRDGMIDIEYVESIDGEPAFQLKTSGQYYTQQGGSAIGMYWWKGDGSQPTDRDEFMASIGGGFCKWYIREVTDMDIQSNYTLADGTIYTNNSPIFAEEFHYTRNLKNTQLQAMYVPAALPVETFTNQGVSVYYLNDNHAYFDASGNIERMTMEVAPITSGTLIANTPYVIRASETGVKDFVAKDVIVYPAEEKSIDCSSTTIKFTFTGTNDKVSSSVLRQNEYYFFSGGGLKQIGTSTASLGAQRWYMDIETRGAQYSAAKPAEVKVVIFGEEAWDDETGIQFTEAEETSKSNVYDLSGRKVATPTKAGLYIQNGRKVLVK